VETRCSPTRPGTAVGLVPTPSNEGSERMRPIRWFASLSGIALCTGCAAPNPHYDPRQPHHRSDGFQNNHVDFAPKGVGELLRWRWQAWQAGLPPAPQQAVPEQAPDIAFVHANARAAAAMQPAVTWIGHASVLVQAGGLNMLTDPIFSERASPVGFAGPRRAQPPGLRLDQLPRIDLVVISHNHYDHLDEASVKALTAQPGGPPLFVVPLGLKSWLAERGILNAVELDWWGVHRIGDTEVMLTPVQHWSARGLNDRMATLWGGFAVLGPDLHWFYSGDTGLSKDFSEVARRLADRQRHGGFDLALLAIGAYEPRWFMATQHINPAEAVQVHRDLGARRSMAVHWGTFEMSDEALDQPPRDLAAARLAQGLSEDEFFVLAIGQTRRLPRRTAP
jgi:N-acyl-phosphatidylethanolamine-hydrolysing phospholipase D